MNAHWHHRVSSLPGSFARASRDAVRAARNGDLPAGMRMTCAKEAMRFWISDHTGQQNPAQLAGYHVGYLRHQSLRYLYREVFVNACYAFRTSSQQPVILDAGSNIGMAMLFFKKIFPAAQITCFEPDPETFSVLSRNVDQNGLSGVTLHQVALTGHDGTVDFYHSEDEAGSLLMSINQERMPGQRIEVPSRSLSPFITGEVDLLKLDIEGAERAVLTEVAASGKLRQIKQMHIEYHHHIGAAADCLSKTLALLEDEGFGYQVGADPGPMENLGTFQDISLHAYRRP